MERTLRLANFSITRLRNYFSRSNGVRAGLILAVLLNIFFFPYIWGNATLLSASRDAASLYPSGALATPSHQRVSRFLDPGAAAWQTEPDFAVEHAEIFVEHHLPIWNEHAGYGTPLAADMISQPYFPLTLLAILHPSPRMYDIWVVSRLFVAGLFAFLFLRLFVAFWPALGGGISFMLTGYFLLYPNIAHISVEALIPAWFLVIECWLRRQRGLQTALLGFTLTAIILGGMPESALLDISFGYLYFIFRVASDRELRHNIFYTVFSFAVVNVLGFGLSGFLLIPFSEYLQISANVHEPKITGIVWGPLHDHFNNGIATYIFPLSFGPPWNSIATGFSGGYGLRGFFGLSAFFFSLTALAGAVAHAVRGRLNRDHKLTFFFVLSAMLLVMKRYGLVLINWIGHLPGFALVNFPKYDEPLLGFAIAVLVGFGLSAIFSRRSVPIIAIAAVGTFAVATLAYDNTRYLPKIAGPYIGYYYYSLILAICILCLVIAVSFAIQSTSIRLARVRFVLAPLVLALLTLEATANYLIPLYYVENPPVSAAANPYQSVPYVSFLQKHIHNQERVLGLNGFLFPNWAGAFNLGDIEDLDPLYYKKYLRFVDDFLSAPASPSDLHDRFDGTGGYAFGTNLQRRLLAISSVKYIVGGGLEGTSGVVNDILTQNSGKIPPDKADYVRVGGYRIAGTSKDALFEHAPYSRLPYAVVVPKTATRLLFSIGMLPQVWRTAPVCGDGVRFILEAQTKSGMPRTLFSAYIDPKHDPSLRHWINESVSVAAMAGKPARFLFTTQTGPSGNNCGDWAVWGGIAFNGTRASVSRIIGPKFTEVYHGDASIYEVSPVLPRATIYHNVSPVVDDEHVLAQLAAPDFDIANTLLIAKDALWPSGLALQSLARSGGHAEAGKILFYDSQYARISATTRSPGILMFNDMNYPGWRGYVDGKRVPVFTVDYLFRGVELAPGHHIVTFRYEPTSLRDGWLVSGASLVLLLLFCCLGNWLPKRRAIGQTDG